MINLSLDHQGSTIETNSKNSDSLAALDQSIASMRSRIQSDTTILSNSVNRAHQKIVSDKEIDTIIHEAENHRVRTFFKGIVKVALGVVGLTIYTPLFSVIGGLSEFKLLPFEPIQYMAHGVSSGGKEIFNSTLSKSRLIARDRISRQRLDRDLEETSKLVGLATKLTADISELKTKQEERLKKYRAMEQHLQEEFSHMENAQGLTIKFADLSRIETEDRDFVSKQSVDCQRELNILAKDLLLARGQQENV